MLAAKERDSDYDQAVVHIMDSSLGVRYCPIRFWTVVRIL